nr:spike protein [Mute swan feces associated gammacoronavirus]
MKAFCSFLLISLISLCFCEVPLLCSNVTEGNDRCVSCLSIPQYTNGQNGGDAMDFYSPDVMRPIDGTYVYNGYYKPVLSGCFNHTNRKDNLCTLSSGDYLNFTLPAQTLSQFQAFGLMYWWGVQKGSNQPTFNFTIGNFTFKSLDAIGFSKVKSIIVLSTGHIYINGVLLGVYGIDFNNTLTSYSAQCIGSIKIVLLQDSNALVHFQSGNVVQFKPCLAEDIFSILQCSNTQFNFTPGLYAFDSPLTVNVSTTFLPRPVVGDTLSFAYIEHTIAFPDNNASAVNVNTTYFTIKCSPQSCYGNYRFYTPGSPVYGNLGITVGTVPKYVTCEERGLSISRVNNDNCFDLFEFSTQFQTSKEEFVSQSQSYSCVYVLKVTESNTKYLWVGVNFVFGTKYCAVAKVPTYTIYLDQCHDYNIYGVRGTGIITNVTSQNSILSDGGIAISNGANGLLAFRNNGSLYTVTPCSTLQTQAVTFTNTTLGLYVPSNCSNFDTTLLGNSSVQLSSGGCLVTNQTTTTRRKRGVEALGGVVLNTVCTGNYVAIGADCIYSNGTIFTIGHLVSGVDTTITPLLNVTANVSIPYELTLAVTTEYIQTQYTKVTIDCARYVCGTSFKCRSLLEQYGSFCTSINNILQGINSNEDAGVLDFVSNIGANYNLNLTGFDSNNLGGFNLSLVVPKNIGGSMTPSGRSVIEDLLFDKVTTVGLGDVDANYDQCMSKRGAPLTNIADLTCAQYYNGVMVLPGVVDPTMMGVYTTSLIGGMALGGLTSAASIPFSMQIQSRVNYIALSQSVLMDNQNLIANSFNNALDKIQSALNTISDGFKEVAAGFESVSSALNKIQDVVNSHSEVLTKLMEQLNVNFGAISASLEDIYAQLDELNANAQVDRLITGRLTALSTYASSLQLSAYKAEQSRRLALQKIEECVKSQSMRYGFCGNGSHVLTIPQNAPNGMFFIHYTYQPVTYRQVLAVPGLCVQTDRGQYGLMPKTGSGLIFVENSTFYVTSRTLFKPTLLTYSDVVNLTSCEASYYYVNESDTPFVSELPDFDSEFESVYKELNSSKDLIDHIVTDFNYTIPILDLKDDICKINSSINALWNASSVIDEINAALNDTYINLEQLNKVTRYIRWPWYVWLAIAFLSIIFILILGWIFFMTGCCGGCCGCCGLIPLAQRCSKRSSYYQTFDDDVVGERIRPKKNV